MKTKKRIFPNTKSFFNLIFMFLFGLVALSLHEPTPTLLAALGMIYCYNEWIKE